MARGEDAHRIGEVLDKLERATREVAKSVDVMRGEINRSRLGKARESLAVVMGQLDAILAERP